MSTFDLTHDLTHEPKPTVVRRLEVITDVGGRRKWSVDAKAEIMLEAACARRDGVGGGAPP